MKFVMGSPQSLEAQFTRQDEVNKERLESSAADNTTHDEKLNEQQPEQVPKRDESDDGKPALQVGKRWERCRHRPDERH